MTTVVCRYCGGVTELPVADDSVREWRRSGKMIQNALPQLSPSQRELLISGCCGKCFDAMFPGDE